MNEFALATREDGVESQIQSAAIARDCALDRSAPDWITPMIKALQHRQPRQRRLRDISARHSTCSSPKLEGRNEAGGWIKVDLFLQDQVPTRFDAAEGQRNR